MEINDSKSQISEDEMDPNSCGSGSGDGDIVYRLIISQLLQDGHEKIAEEIREIREIGSDPPCRASDDLRLMIGAMKTSHKPQKEQIFSSDGSAQVLAPQPAEVEPGREQQGHTDKKEQVCASGSRDAIRAAPPDPEAPVQKKKIRRGRGGLGGRGGRGGRGKDGGWRGRDDGRVAKNWHGERQYTTYNITLFKN